MQRVGINRRIVRVAPEAVGFCISLYQCDAVRIPARGAHVAQRFRVDRKEPAGRAVFRGHIGNRGPIRQGQRVQTRAIELNKLAHDPLGTQHLNDLENKVRSRRALHHLTGQLKAHNLGDQHRNRLP